jgi:YegS/Rv2252/BmrU family lipid kinase
VFERAGIEVVHETVRKSKGVPSLVRRHGREVDAIVLGGGDGTIHSAARELMDAGRPVGVLPLGTANDLARSLGLPLDIEKAAEVIVAGATRSVDVGEVNDELFFNVAHIGLGAELEYSLSKKMKKRLGPLGYTVAAGIALVRLRPFKAVVAADGEAQRFTSFAITVGNGRYFGGNGTVSEEAQIDDGRLHLFAVATRNPLKLAAMAPSFIRGRQGTWKDVHTLTAEAIEIRTARPMKIRADGKMVGETPAVFRVHRGALPVFAPA